MMRFLIALVLAVSMAGAAYADTLRFGGFNIAWPDGFSKSGGGEGYTIYTNAQGAGVTVTSIGYKVVSPAATAASIQQWRDYALSKMPEIAARHGTTVVPLHEERLKSGSILFSLAVRKTDGAGTSGLFFFVIAPDSRVAQIVVEGLGTPQAQYARLRPLFDGAVWDHQ